MYILSTYQAHFGSFKDLKRC